MTTELEELSIIIGKALLSTKYFSVEALSEVIPASLLAATNAIESGYGRGEAVALRQVPRKIEEVDLFNRDWIIRLSTRMSQLDEENPSTEALIEAVPRNRAEELWCDDDFETTNS